jgi:hypothetical protein
MKAQKAAMPSIFVLVSTGTLHVGAVVELCVDALQSMGGFASCGQQLCL